MPSPDKRRIIGRRIVDVEWHAFRDGRGGYAHDPEIVLDNGDRLRFVTEETEVGEYGVALVLAKHDR